MRSKIALEPSRRAEDQRPRFGAAEVGEGVRNTAGSEGKLSPLSRKQLIPEPKRELAFEHVERLVEVVVVQRPQETGADDVAHNGELSSALLATQKDVDLCPFGCHLFLLRVALLKWDRWFPSLAFSRLKGLPFRA
jgi:hypothetical protein